MEHLHRMKDGSVVVIVGAGFSALALCQEMIEMKERRKIVVVDQNASVGGMWLSPYKGLSLHGPRKSISHPSTYHLWKEIGTEDMANPQDLCKYASSVRAFLEARGVCFLMNTTVIKNNGILLAVSSNGDQIALDPIESVIDARCSNIKVQGFAVTVKENNENKRTLVVGAGKQGVDVALYRMKYKGESITFASRVPIAFVMRENMTDPKAGLFPVIARLTKCVTKESWLKCCEDMVLEGTLFNPFSCGSKDIEFHGGILSLKEINLLKSASFLQGEHVMGNKIEREFGNVIRCTGAFREATVRDSINDTDKMKTMRFMYTPVVSAQLFCAVGSRVMNTHPINYSLYPNRFAMMAQLMQELCDSNIDSFVEKSLVLSNPSDADLLNNDLRRLYFRRHKDADVVQTEAVLQVAIILPGADGSTLHFKGLTEYIKKASNFCIHEMDTKSFRGMKDVHEIALQIEAQSRSKDCHLFGYSMAGLLIRHIWSAFARTERTISSITLFDPVYDVSKVTRGADYNILETKMMALSVMDYNAIDKYEYDWNEVKREMLNMFPMYEERFEGFKHWLDLTEYSKEIGTSFEADPTMLLCPFLLIVAKHTEKMFIGSTGGPQCIHTWKRMVPHAKVVTVDARHVDIPYCVSAIEACIDFLFKGCLSHDEMTNATERMETVLRLLASARNTFKERWKSKHDDSRFILNTDANDHSRKMDPLQSLLSRFHLTQYSHNFNKLGYVEGEIDFIAYLDDCHLKSIANDLNLYPNDVVQFMNLSKSLFPY